MLSAEPESACLPSGLNATLKTLAEWPSSTRTCRPLSTSHSRTVLSAEPESACLPSGLNATERTQSVCPSDITFASNLARAASSSGVTSAFFGGRHDSSSFGYSRPRASARQSTYNRCASENLTGESSKRSGMNRRSLFTGSRNR